MGRRQSKVLFVTFEYGNHIAGGIGRVLNGVGPLLETMTDLDILLIKNRSESYLIHNQRWERTNLSFFRFRQRVSKLIRDGQYDVVHFFHVSQIVAKMAELIKLAFPDIKLVYSCHSIAKYESGIRSNDPEFLNYENSILNRIDHIHLLNRSSEKYYQKAYPIPARKLARTIIPNGIEEASFQTRDPDFEAYLKRLLKGRTPILVVYIARWAQGKGLEYLLDAIPKVVAHNRNVQFVIAGRKMNSWEFQYKSYLKGINQKIAALGEHVTALGWLGDKQRNSLLALGDIWVMPSLLEYFPYSILEPMIAKIPIVSARIDSVQEMLREPDECLFYEPTLSDQLAERLLLLAENSGLRERLAANAYQQAKKKYQWSAIAQRYCRMYQDIVDQQVAR